MSKTKLISIGISSLYFYIYIYIYISYLSVKWWYFGFTYKSLSINELVIGYFLVTIPVSWLSITIDKYSSMVSWMIYYFLYIPILTTLLLRDSAPDEKNILILSISLSFLIISKFPSIKLNIKYYSIRKDTFWKIFLFIYLILLGYVIIIFRNSFNLVNLLAIYDQRTLGSKVVGDSYAGYAIGLLSGAMNPFLMGVGLVKKKGHIYFLGAIGQLLIFATFALKSVFLSILIIPIFHYLLFSRKSNKTSRIGALIICSLIFPMLMGMILDDDSTSILKSIIWLRTYGIVGTLVGGYADFFNNHPFTYFSHINVISIFIDYPYILSLGFVISDSMGLDGMNANASFFATDGIASGGSIGVVLIGIIVGFFLQLFNNIIGREYLTLASISSVPTIMSLSNSSFFTTLLTGGLFLLIFFLYLWRSIDKK